MVLAFLERGISFTEIGFLIAIREIGINLFEIPTGAIADVVGRRRSMIASFMAYIAAFIVFFLFTSFPGVATGMVFFAIGEAFRTGTHKAIIFDWLKSDGRQSERTKVYGYTRSWSKRGSAVSVLIATAIVLSTDRYNWIFIASIIPYLAGIVNFLRYPAYLDGSTATSASMKKIFLAMGDGLSSMWKTRSLRAILIESMGFEGIFKIVKDYAQPLLEVAALSIPIMIGIENRQRTAILVGTVYFLMHLASSRAAKNAYKLSSLVRGDGSAARLIWLIALLAYSIMTFGIGNGISMVAIVAFVGLAIIQDAWRPILISRVAAVADSDRLATILSTESQAKSLFAAIVAPILGIVADAGSGVDRFLPVALVGVVVALTGAILGGKGGSQ